VLANVCQAAAHCRPVLFFLKIYFAVEPLKPEQSFDFAAGEVLLVDKPPGWTSFDAVKKIRNLVKVKKVGHAGTLDPLATGLLIICTGKMTKQIAGFQAEEKEYTGTITLGATTPSYDLETQPENFCDTAHLSIEQVKQAASEFTGTIEQVPPVFSAIKVDGKRAYNLARNQQEAKMKPRQVTVSEFSITRFELPEADFKIVCSKGTYIRSLAHDLGQKLGTGGYLSALRRNRSGSFSVEDALEPTQWAAVIKKRNTRPDTPDTD